MKQMLGALIFALFTLVALSGAAPNPGGPPPLQRVAEQIVQCVHLR